MLGSKRLERPANWNYCKLYANLFDHALRAWSKFNGYASRTNQATFSQPTLVWFTDC